MTSTAAAAGHALPVRARMSNGKLAMWIFLASEVMFFAGLIGTYIVLRMSVPEEFHPDSVAEKYGSKLNEWLAGVNTLVLIASSYTMVLAVSSARKKNDKKVRNYLLLTAGFGIAFCTLKGVEYYTKFSHDIFPSTSIFYSCYFTTTGVHLLHVIGGIVPLLIFAFRARSGCFTKPGSISVELLGLYWHFVDLVWIFLFPLLYLIR